MFKSEAKLFLSANNNVNSAKTLINECKRLIVDFDLTGDSNSNDLKNNINNCNIDSLVDKIEETKESLMKLDQTFASEYMTLLQEYLQSQTIDTSSMTEEEQMKYSIQMNAYARDYNQNLLYMLERYEESGMLTDEMKQQLEYQRELVAQYDIKDKMAVLDSTSEEYIDLFKKNAESDRKLINLDPSLTEEQKVSYLNAYETNYNQQLQALQEAIDYKLKNDKLEKELQDLYKAKEDNNGFFHPFVESEIEEAILDKKIEIGKFNPKSPYAATEDDIDYKNMNGWDRFWTNTGTFLTSTFTGLYDISEGIEDGFITLGSAVGIVDKDWATEFVSKDLSGELYQGIVLNKGMNTTSAYGTWHEVGEVFGGFVGKVGMSFACPWVNTVMSGLSATGHQAEISFNNGDDYWMAVGKSFISGIGGAAEGFAYSKMKMAFREMRGKGTIKQLWKQVITNGETLSKEGLKQVGKTFGHSLISAAIDPDSLIESGCVVANDFMNFLATEEFNLEETLKKVGKAYLYNLGIKFASDLAFGYEPFGKKVDELVNSNVAEQHFKNKNADILLQNSNLSNIDYVVEITSKMDEYNQLLDNASDDVKYALEEAKSGHAIGFSSQADVDVYTKLSKLQKEIGDLQKHINLNINTNVGKIDSAQRAKIKGTNIDVVYAYDECLKPYEGRIYETYGMTNLPKEQVIDNLETIKKYDGRTIGDKLDTIRKNEGQYSIKSVTAESTAMQTIIEIRQSSVQSKVSKSHNKISVVQKQVDDMLELTNSSQYKQFKTPKEARKYFKSDLEYWDSAQKSISLDDPKYLGYEGMRDYTGSIGMNPYMRNIGPLNSKSEALIGNLANTLDEFKLQDDIVFYRGVDEMDWLLKENNLPIGSENLKLLSGGTVIVSDNAFMSVTPVMGEGFTYKKIVEVIKAPAGTKGLFVDTFSSCPDEVEFLIQAGEGNRKVLQAVEEIGDQIFVYSVIVPK